MSPAQPLDRHLKGMADKRIQEQLVWLCPRSLFAAVCYNSFQLIQNEASPPSHKVNLVLAIFAIVGTVKPQWMTPRIFLAFHFVVYGALLFLAITASSRMEFLSTNRARICFRVMLSLIEARPRVSLFLGIVYSTAISPWYEPVDARQELFVSLWVSLSAAVVALARDAEFLATLEAKASRNFESTADGLLSTMCDAVVHLSTDLCLSKPCGRLAALLLRQSTDMDSGVDFANLAFDATEKARLIRFLERPVSDTYSLHVSFRDARDSPVKVELFHVQGVDIHDNLIHIVGVKDDSSEPPAARPGRLRHSPDASHSNAVNCSIPEDDILTDISASESGVSSGLPIDTPCTEMVLHIAPEEDGLPILRCSPDFLRLCGPIREGAGLLQWVVNHRAFMDWAGTTYGNMILGHGGDVVHDDMDARPFRIRLRLPHMGPTVREVRASTRFRLEESGGDCSRAPPAGGIMLILEDVVFAKRLQSRSERRSGRRAVGTPSQPMLLSL